VKKKLTPHDRFFRFVFSRRESARDLVLNLLPDRVIHLLDLVAIEVARLLEGPS